MNAELSVSDPEVKNINTFSIHSIVSDECDSVLDRLKRLSFWQLACKAVAWCLRLKTRKAADVQSKSVSMNATREDGKANHVNAVTVSAIKDAEGRIIRALQAECFAEDLKVFKANNPDKEDIYALTYRVDTR